MRHAQGVSSVIEFGANIGMNLMAWRMLYPQQEQFGVEINVQSAAERGQVIPPANVFQQSILEFSPVLT